jgi:hypothetical protein
MRACVISFLVKLTVVSADASHPAPVGFLKSAPPLPKTQELGYSHHAFDLLSDIVEALAGYESEDNEGSLWDLQAIEESLKPIIAASPKNEYGRLGDGAARYALHRLFMERHGWEIKGFGDFAVQAPDSSSSSTNFLSSSAASPSQPSLFEHWVPPEVQSVLEERVKVKGFGPVELAVFAASLEHVIRAELPRKLQDTYRALGVPTYGAIAKSQAEYLIDLYMGAFIRSEDLTMLSPSELFKFQTDMSFVYDDWDKTREFFRQIQESLVPDKETLSFEDVVAVLEDIETNFVYWNEHQCAAFKDDLLSLEKELPGRVRLLDFYEGSLYKGMSRFAESKEYLKELGTIDDTDPLEPRLILSNYVHAPSNCVARSSFYSVCCMNQCDDLYNHLERNIGKPEATAEEIISVVSGLSTATTCNILPDDLQVKLHTIADKNHGQVLLHGKAFAEWMHFVYPRECTWQQKYGPAYSQTEEEWLEATHIESQANTQELMLYTEQLRGMDQLKRARSNSTVNKNARPAFMAPRVEQQPVQSSEEPVNLAVDVEPPMTGASSLEPVPPAVEEEVPMIGASRKKSQKKREKKSLLVPEGVGTPSAGSSGSASVYWCVGPVLGALYGAALGVVKLLSFRSESLRQSEASCGASCSYGDSHASCHV